MKRIGILAGTFDPVHKGHISFALQAIEAAGLDMVAFVPEPKPRHKHDVTHISHRISMLQIACTAHPTLSVFALPDKQFTVATSLPRLVKQYPDAQLFMLIGTDVLAHISVWPLAKALLRQVGLVVAVRGQKDERQALLLLAALPVEPLESHVIISNYKSTASRDIRAAVTSGKTPEGMLEATAAYAREHWLYSTMNQSR